jgi:hypothetical protein
MKRQYAQRKKAVKQVKDKANRYSKSATPWCATLGNDAYFQIYTVVKKTVADESTQEGGQQASARLNAGLERTPA